MDTPTARNDGKPIVWNGAAAQGWVEAQALLDRLFQPFEELLVRQVTQSGASTVLDVGCGTGSTTLAMARQLGNNGHCTGIDISAPMLALATARAGLTASTARFIEADAQRHAFTAGSVDLVTSRFGVMFFDDPVAAFANLRRATRAGGHLYCQTWRSADDNPFMTAAELAAAPWLPGLPARKPHEPGQFGLADAGYVKTILQEAGWRDAALTPLDIDCVMQDQELQVYLERLGPVGRLLPSLQAPIRSQALAAVRQAFAPWMQVGTVRFTAACWAVTARA